MEEDLLPVLLKLVKGDKERCYELIKAIRSKHPEKPMHWCIQKAIYDVRFGKQPVKPNATLARWGGGGGEFPTTAKPGPQPANSSPVGTAKPASQPPNTSTAKARPLPPPPPPNPMLSKPKTERWGVHGVQLKASNEKPLALSTGDLEALLKAKRKMASSKPASEASRKRLFRLCNGNIDQARRLVQRVRVANPDRSEQWAVEKCIYDLERDRL